MIFFITSESYIFSIIFSDGTASWWDCGRKSKVLHSSSRSIIFTDNEVLRCHQCVSLYCYETVGGGELPKQ